MTAWTSFCHKYLIKKNWQERNVYSFGKCYKGCYSQHLYWLNMNWFKRMYRLWYKVIDIETFKTVPYVHRVSDYSRYTFKEYKMYLR